MTQKSAEDDLRNEIAKLLKAQPIDSIREMVRNDAELEEMAKQLGPQTKDELWQWFKDVIGIELGRVAVCPGHHSQLDILWEIYSFEVTRVLLVLSRGGGKTSSMAWLDYCQAFFYPGWESFTIGPGRNQGERKYDHLLPHVVEGGVIGGKEKEHVLRSVMTKTELKNGSKMEIALGGGVDNANGPRVPRLHRDETELMQGDTYKQAGNIPAGRKTRDGRYVPAQIVDTSTMKWAGGRIDTQIQQYNIAKEKGERPSLEVRISCLFEAAAENPYCRSVPDDVRQARLVELGLDPDKKCDCQTYVKDVWESDDPNVEPKPRTLESVCEGRFFRSRGYKEFDDIQTLFLENERQTWEAEQECSEPSREGAFLKSYSQTKHGIRDYIPDPENGFIYEMVDWGGTDENFMGMFQILDRDVTVLSYKGGKQKIMPKGSFVVFRELYRADIGPSELAEETKEMETGFVIAYPGWRVHERYPDSANAGARKDWAKLHKMPTVSRIKKDFKLEVSYVRSRVSGAHFYVDIPACPWFDKSLQAWRQENGHEIHDWACLVADTMIQTEAGEKRIDSVVAGERVWTREGLKHVAWSGYTKHAETVLVQTESGSFECTDDHRVWTQNRGWVEAGDLSHNDMILPWTSFEKSGCASMSSIGISGGTAILTRNGRRTETTSAPAASFCTDGSGRTSGEASPKGLRSTMRTGIRATTTSATFEPSLLQSTDGSMASSHDLKSSLTTSSAFDRWQSQHHEHQRREFERLSDFESSGRVALSEPEDASSVVSPSRLERLAPLGSAHRGVDLLNAGSQGSTTSSDPVPDAASPSSRTGTPSSAPVGTRVLLVSSTGRTEPVFDLEVEECHEFFANGVLVHNSHAMAAFRYAEHNLQVVKRGQGRSQRQTVPAAADDDGDRRDERLSELDASVHGSDQPPGVPRVIRNPGHQEEGMDFDEFGGADDSPLRDETRSMGQPGSRRSYTN